MSTHYFEQLNYTLANEDASLEASILHASAEHVLAVCGSGSRVIPLLTQAPKKISIIDISAPQLHLCRLRVETLRSFTHQEFLCFWGYESGMSPEDRKLAFHRLNLPPDTRDYLAQVFDHSQWNSILLNGRWEKTFVFFSKLARLILGKNLIAKIFNSDSLTDQVQYVEKELKGWRWKLLLLIAGNAKTFNALLYSGSFPENNTGLTYLEYYERAFDRLFRQGLARENFFLQLTLLGELKFPEGRPIEAEPQIFEAAKQNLSRVELEYVCEDLVSWTSRQTAVDFISFSNVASYFTGDLERNFLQTIRPGMKMGGKVILRHYLHLPENMNREGFQDLTGNFDSNCASEKLQMYTIEILEKRSP